MKMVSIQIEIDGNFLSMEVPATLATDALVCFVNEKNDVIINAAANDISIIKIQTSWREV